MKKIIIIVSIICLSVIAILISMFSGTEGKKAAAIPENVTAKQQKPAPLSIDVFGIVKAKENRNIVIDFPAYVEKVMVREGERVRQGMPLICLNNLEFTAQIHTQENDLKNIQNLYNQDSKQLADREELWQSGSISRYDLDEFRKTLDSRKTTMLNLTSSLQAMQDKLDRPYLRNNEIISDMKNAVVYDLNCAAGDKIGQPDPVRVLSLLNLDSLVVMADVDEEFITKIQPGAKAEIKLLANRSLNYQGSVTRVYNRAIIKNNETYIPVEVTINNIDKNIAPEMNVDLKIFNN